MPFDINFLFDLLKLFGITPSNIVPLAIFGIVAYLTFSRKLHGYLTPIKLAITEIQTIISTGGYSIKHSLTETSKSPLQPTDFGVELIKKSGIDKFVNNNKDFLFKKLEEKLKGKVYTSYDIQEKSIEIMIELKSSELINEIKEFVFNNGMEIEAVLRLGGLLLRDMFLKEKR